MGGEPITLDLSQWREKMKDTDNFISNLELQNTEIIKSTPIFCDFDEKFNAMLLQRVNYIIQTPII